METDNNSTRCEAFADEAEFDAAVARARAAADAYYNTGRPVMADPHYDLLADRIAATLRAHPDWDDHGVTTRVGAGMAGGEMRHPTPMLSLDKASTTSELDAFLTAVGAAALVVEPKLDGMAVRARYRHGVLMLAVRRGDGVTGDNITDRVLRDGGPTGLPTALPSRWSGEIRGELFMTDSDYATANTNRVAAGKPAFSNPTAAVAGSINARRPSYRAPMSFAAYDITGDGIDADTHLERMRIARALGFHTAASLAGATAPLTTRDFVHQHIAEHAERRPTLGYPTDGVVIKVDALEIRERLGASSRAPRWAIAYKFPPTTELSVLRDIEVAVGRTGQASFRAVIDPVTVRGTTVIRATLHNANWIQEQKLGIGSRVQVSRANDVIPRVTQAAGEQPAGITPWTPPTECPDCGQPWDTSSVNWRCATPACSVGARIVYAASRDVWDIDGLGPEIAAALVEANLAGDIADLFALTADQIADLTLPAADGAPRRIGGGVAQRIITAINAATTKPLHCTITAFGIRHTGRRIGRTLAEHFGSLAALRAASIDELTAIDGIGAGKAQSIHRGLRSMAEVIDRLISAGITTEHEHPAHIGTPGPLTGKSVVITGHVPGLNRGEAEDAARALGASVRSSVSAATDLVIVGDANSSKARRAAALRIDTMPAAEFARLHDPRTRV